MLPVRRGLLVLSIVMFLAGCGKPGMPRSRFGPDEVSLAEPTVVHFSPDDPYRPILPVKINGVYDAAMQLDTGASFTVLSRAATNYSGTTVLKTDFQLADAAGNRKNADGEVVVKSMELNTAYFGATPAFVSGVGVLQGRQEYAIDGVLGLPVFQDVLLTIDYPRQRLIITNESLPEPDGQTVFPLVIDRAGHAFMPITIGDRLIPAMIDTGYDGGLTVPVQVAQTMNPQGRPVAGPSARTWQGAMQQTMFRNRDDLVIGRHVIEQPIIMVAAGGGAPVIGADYLRHFTVSIDQRNGRVAFHRAAVSPIKVPPITLSGFVADRRTKEVTEVIEGSFASRAGLAVGDRIKQMIAVATKPPEQASLNLAATPPPADEPPQPKLHLVVERDGQERELDVPLLVVLP